MLTGLEAWILARSLPIAGTACAVGAWCVAEYLARRSTWNQGAPRRPSSAMDRGTYPVIAIGLAVSLLFDLFALAAGWTAHPSVLLVALGLGISAAGLALRGWALRTLGRFFTMPITIAPDHQIVRTGPYRWLRHPAYTGGFLTVLGLPVILGSWPALVVTLCACTSVYVYRIRIEEAALLRRFGDAYREYSASTNRLFPGLY